MGDKNINSSNKEKMHKSKTKPAIGWFLLGTAILFIGVALLVHIFSPKIDSLITADGMLSYVISCISSAATVGLAYVAYRQTERANSMAEMMTEQSNLIARQANELTEKSDKTAQKANELSQQANALSERVTLLEESRYKMEVRPFVLVTNWEVKTGRPDEDNIISYQVATCDANDTVSIVLELTNTTQCFEIVQYKEAETASENDKTPTKWGLSVVNRNSISIGIPSGESRKVCFYANKKFFAKTEGHDIDIQFILINRFGDRFNESMKLCVMRLNWERGDCMIFPQNYKVQEYAKDHKTLLE